MEQRQYVIRAVTKESTTDLVTHLCKLLWREVKEGLQTGLVFLFEFRRVSKTRKATKREIFNSNSEDVLLTRLQRG